jgi:hypothetical protein
MARVLATVSGTALRPGVSRNRRYYSPEAIAQAVARAQEQLAEGGVPLAMRSHHGADDDSTRLVGVVRSLTLAEDGSARFTADIADTEHGRTIAALLDTSDGRPPFLSGVSIRGAWIGKVRKENGPDGPIERGESLSLLGLDYTASPGVPGAQVDAFTWAKDGATETDERVLITESVEEARVTTITEEAPAVPDGVREALRGILAVPAAVLEAGTPPLSKRDSGLTDGNGRKFADPGYQQDKKQRYDLSTKAHAKSAWSFISKPANQKFYSGPQLKQVKKRIVAALKGFGVTVAAEGWSVDPPLLITEAVAEYAGMDPECAGSYSLTASNGPTTVTVCSYQLDPADLHAILAQACCAASAALASIDPDMDGDIDVPGADAEDDDDDADDLANGTSLPDNGDGVDSLVARLMAAIRGESAEDPDAVLAEAMNASAPAVTETAPDKEDPAPEPAAANQGTEAPMTETTTTEAAGTPTAAAFSKADLDDAVTSALAKAEEARRARKAAKRGTVAAPAETAQPPAAPVTETDDQRIARIVEARLAASQPAAPAPVTETEDARITRIVEARLVTERQRLTEQGSGPGRKGLAPGGEVNEHTGARPGGEAGLNEFGLPLDWPHKPLHQFTGEELEQYANPVLVRHVLKDRADLIG